MDYSRETHAEYIAFCDGLIKEGKLVGDHKSLAVAILDYFAGNSGRIIEFSEGNTRRSMSPLTAIKRFLSSQPASRGYLQEHAVVSYMEIHQVDYKEGLLEVSRRNPELFGLQSLSYQAGTQDDLREAEIARFMEANPAESYSRAFIEVSRRSPQLFDIPKGGLH